MLILTTDVQHCTGQPSLHNQTRKVIKSKKIRKYVKLSLLENTLIDYVEQSKEYANNYYLQALSLNWVVMGQNLNWVVVGSLYKKLHFYALKANCKLLAWLMGWLTFNFSVGCIYLVVYGDIQCKYFIAFLLGLLREEFLSRA